MYKLLKTSRKITLSYIDRLLPEHTEYSVCDAKSTVSVEKSSGADILSYSITVILTVMASSPHVCCSSSGSSSSSSGGGSSISSSSSGSGGGSGSSSSSSSSSNRNNNSSSDSSIRGSSGISK